MCLVSLPQTNAFVNVKRRYMYCVSKIHSGFVNVAELDSFKENAN